MIQPFKNYTIEMGGAMTNGMEEKSGAEITTGGKNIDPIKRDFSSGKYQAICFKISSNAKSDQAHEGHLATTSTEQVVGILGEVFDHPMGSQSLASGIVSQIAKSAIAQGDYVTVAEKGKIKKATTATDKVFGMAISEAKNDGDEIQILLQIGGIKVG